MKMIAIKNLSIRQDRIVAYGLLTLPATIQTKAYPAISIWIMDGAEPIIVTYDTVEERDTDLDILDETFIERVS